MTKKRLSLSSESINPVGDFDVFKVPDQADIQMLKKLLDQSDKAAAVFGRAIADALVLAEPFYVARDRANGFIRSLAEKNSLLISEGWRWNTDEQCFQRKM